MTFSFIQTFSRFSIVGLVDLKMLDFGDRAYLKIKIVEMKIGCLEDGKCGGLAGMPRP